MIRIFDDYQNRWRLRTRVTQLHNITESEKWKHRIPWKSGRKDTRRRYASTKSVSTHLIFTFRLHVITPRCFYQFNYTGIRSLAQSWSTFRQDSLNIVDGAVCHKRCDTFRLLCTRLFVARSSKRYFQASNSKAKHAINEKSVATRKSIIVCLNKIIDRTGERLYAPNKSVLNEEKNNDASLFLWRNKVYQFVIRIDLTPDKFHFSRTTIEDFAGSWKTNDLSLRITC